MRIAEGRRVWSCRSERGRSGVRGGQFGGGAAFLFVVVVAVGVASSLDFLDFGGMISGFFTF